MTNLQQEQGIKIGDLVRLNSGGPDMKVMTTDGDKVTVEWKAIQSASFPLACVYPVRPLVAR